ncbi:MAG TPA: radical SAM protein [Coriobacteriia bacterium]|nr:radical SAM protein [Coriobacteriia bacterium]
MGFSENLYYAKWFFDCKFRGKRKPLQSVIFITDRCNLRCVHCNVVKEGPEVQTRSYAQIEETLQQCYDAGSRIVDFEGGEPLLWRDGPHNIDSLIALAKRIGFHTTTVTTNGQLPITVKPNLIWVSLDGMEQAHDATRGNGSWRRLMDNIEACEFSNLNVNMTITTLNYKDVEDVVRFVGDHPKIKKISLSFYTPYEGRDLLVDRATRNEILELLLRLKREGLPLMNSAAGLKLMRDPLKVSAGRQCWISNFVVADGTRLNACPGESAGICDECGFGMGAEMALLFKLHPEMLKAGLSVRASS